MYKRQVYAGYDDESLTTAQNSKFEEGTAKYVVFNVTNKDNNVSDNYRIETVPGKDGSATLLNTDNEKVDEDFFKFTNLFPLSTFKQYDVVNIEVGSDGKAKAYRELEHSETDKYPIVKITRIEKDGKVLEVEGKDYKTVVFVDGADLFGKSKLSKLEKGDIVQLKLNKDDTDKKNKNVIDIVSVLKDAKVEGKLEKAGFIKVVQDNGYIGNIVQMPGKSEVVMDTYTLTDKEEVSKNVSYEVDEYVANTLRALYKEGYKEVKFIVKDGKASDFEVNVKKDDQKDYVDNWTKVIASSEEANAQEATINKANEQAVAIANEKAKEAQQAAIAAIKDYEVAIDGELEQDKIEEAVKAAVNNEKVTLVYAEYNKAVNNATIKVTVSVEANKFTVNGQGNELQAGQDKNITVTLKAAK